MNKIQIKAEVLATLNALTMSTKPDSSLLVDLNNIENKEALFDVLIRELSGCDSTKSIIIGWMLFELIEKEQLNDYLWNVIKSPEYNDNVKMVSFNMLKDLGNKVDYSVISDYFEKFDELVNSETKQLLETAIMNPEAQIDFMDFLNALNDNDKILLLKSLEEDYAHDALANIVIPVFLYYQKTSVGDEALKILAKTKSQLAFHALENLKKYSDETTVTKLNKALNELKLSGIRIDNTIEFYKDILKESKPYKSYISFPDGHGNLGIIFSRIRADKTLQFLAVVINLQFGILDAFGFNSMSERDFYRIIDKFYNYEEKYEIKPEVLKHLLLKAVEHSYSSGENLPYEYICWESILLDIESCVPEVNLEKRILSDNDLKKLCFSNYVQNWFFDEITSDEFKTFIDKLSDEYRNNNFNIDIDKFVEDNYQTIYSPELVESLKLKFKIAAYLRLLKGDNDLAQIFYSIDDNKIFLTNILQKSIYEYYVGSRYLLKNQQKNSNLFKKNNSEINLGFELLHLDMIISSIESKWVSNA